MGILGQATEQTPLRKHRGYSGKCIDGYLRRVGRFEEKFDMNDVIVIYYN